MVSEIGRIQPNILLGLERPVMFGNPLSSLIDKLEASIPNVDEGFSWGFEVERHDWRPVWALCKEIQATFRGYKGFDSREQHQKEWERFSELRNRASHLADVEKEKIAAQSNQHKELILSEARAAYWSASADFFVGSVLGHTTVEEMKDLQRQLKDAGRRLSENKRLMTREDKEECFEAIKEARESHDHFWEKYKALREERREASERKHQEFERKRAEWIDRVHANIRKNQSKLEKAENALGHTRDRIRDLEEKIYETTSEKWQGIFSEWLDEARSKEQDIEESIERIAGWISEDERKLNDA